MGVLRGNGVCVGVLRGKRVCVGLLRGNRVCVGVLRGNGEIIYLSLHCHHQNDSCIIKDGQR